MAAAAAFSVDGLTSESGTTFTGIPVEGCVMEVGAGSGLFSCPGVRVVGLGAGGIWLGSGTRTPLIGSTVSMRPAASFI